MKTPPMNHKREVWLESQCLDAIDSGCTIDMIVDRLGIEKKEIAQALKNVMIKHSKPAVHSEHGKVRVFINHCDKSYYIFHAEKHLYFGKESIENHNFKCLPLD